MKTQLMEHSYEGSYQKYDVICDENVMIPMADGVRLATDIYSPANGDRRPDGTFPVILERTPYDKRSALNVAKGKYFARRGYMCAIQDVRGRFKSEGTWYPFAREAPDGRDTVEWLGSQPWSTGKVGTMGGSYAGSDQAALATFDPSHLSTMIVDVGASNYYHSSMRQNGTLEQRFHIYLFRMAATSKEAQADPGLRAALTDAIDNNMPDIVNAFPLKKGATLLSRLPSYEQWAIDILTHGDYDEYWKQRGYAISEYYEQHADVPTLYLGGWYDSYARNTTESFMALNKIKKSPQRLMMGPWTHGQYEVTFSGDVDFGTDSHIDFKDLKLRWFDCYLKGMKTAVREWDPVKIFTMGAGSQHRNSAGLLDHGGYWKSENDWPFPATDFVSYYLHGDSSLSTVKPRLGEDPTTTEYTFDPNDPVPTIGGGISAADTILRPGAFDQRGRIDFHGCKDTLPLNNRRDVLSFETAPMERDVEVTGPVEMHLWASSSAPDTDFTAKMIDVHPSSTDYPEGLSINITDSIIRARYRNGWERQEFMTRDEPYEFVFQLYPTSNVFRMGHRIRLDISSSNWPRFDVNPNTGGPIGFGGRRQIAHQTVYHGEDFPSHIILPLQS